MWTLFVVFLMLKFIEKCVFHLQFYLLYHSCRIRVGIVIGKFKSLRHNLENVTKHPEWRQKVCLLLKIEFSLRKTGKEQRSSVKALYRIVH